MKSNRKYWLKVIGKMVWLYLTESKTKDDLIKKSYDEISNGYDEVWTNHIQVFSKEMINRLSIPKKGVGLDLTCGTGYVTGLLEERMSGNITGVDISPKMIKVAKQKYGDKCNFICSDLLEFLYKQSSKSVDVVTCAWGLGYLQPLKIIKEISRILKPKGQVAIIDNSLFTVYEVIRSGILTVAEFPAAIAHIMNVRWLPTKGSLTRRMKFCGLHVTDSWKGSKTYYAKDGNDAIRRLIDTGTAAGYQFCFDKSYHPIIKQRFAEIFQEQYGEEKGLPITHRYIAAIAMKM